MNGEAAPLIEIDHLTMRFGGLLAVDDVSFIGRPREITAIIGPNGAGKSTFFNCLTGVIRPTDVLPGNVVSSAAVGQLRIQYLGKGLIKDSLTPGWVIRFLNKIF